MAQYCEYCGAALDPKERSCPGCGAPNPFFDPAAEAAPQAPGRPRTIQEL